MGLLGGALCTLLGAVAIWRYIGFRPLPELRPKSYRHSPLLLSLPQCQAHTSGATETSDSNGSSAWKMPRTLICFTSTFVFSKAACYSDLQPNMPFLYQVV